MTEPVLRELTRITARFSATLFAAALFAFAARRRVLSPVALRLFAAFLAAHAVHFSIVFMLAYTTGGRAGDRLHLDCVHGDVCWSRVTIAGRRDPGCHPDRGIPRVSERVTATAEAFALTRTREPSMGVARAGPLPRRSFCCEMIDLRLQRGKSLELNVERQLDRV
jgi:hypothetical protein